VHPVWYYGCCPGSGPLALKGLELGQSFALANVFFNWSRCGAGCDPVAIFRDYIRQQAYSLLDPGEDDRRLLRLDLTPGPEDEINLRAPLVEPVIDEIIWLPPGEVDVTDGAQSATLRVVVKIPQDTPQQ
jgi:hypothetical protein